MKIVLVGYMGSGKSTIGKEVAKNVGIPFYDLDKIIEDTEKSSIKNIFLSRGEIYFRKIESEIFKTFIANNDDFSDYTNGLPPDVSQLEDLANLGVLGETSDPLLETALNYVDANGRFSIPQPDKTFEHFADSKSLQQFGTEMYLEKAPKLLLNRR